MVLLLVLLTILSTATALSGSLRRHEERTRALQASTVHELSRVRTTATAG